MDWTCGWCQVVYAALKELPPEFCPSCQGEDNFWPFPLSVSDRRFLKSLRIWAGGSEAIK